MHIEFEPFDPPYINPDVVVLAGDIHLGVKGLEWARKNFPDKPVIYVPGNHEYYREAMPRFTGKLREAARGSNVHLLENDRVVIRDVVFLGCTLWTDFKLFGNPRIAGYEATQKMTDYRRIRVSPQYRKLRPTDTAGIHSRSLRWLKGELASKSEKAVVITHYAPSQRSIPERHKDDILNAAYASHLDDVVEGSKACLWIHGHIHTRLDYRIGETRVVCNPRGYPDESSDFDPDFAVEVP